MLANAVVPSSTVCSSISSLSVELRYPSCVVALCPPSAGNERRRARACAPGCRETATPEIGGKDPLTAGSELMLIE